MTGRPPTRDDASGPAGPDAVGALVASVRADPAGPGVAQLWRTVYGLERWWLLPTGDTRDPRPMVGVVEDKQFLLAFTSEQHVRTFAAGRAATRTDHEAGDEAAVDPAGITAMAVTPGDVTGLAPALAGSGVAGILFDQGVHDLVAPIGALDTLWTRFGH